MNAPHRSPEGLLALITRLMPGVLAGASAHQWVVHGPTPWAGVFAVSVILCLYVVALELRGDAE